MSTDRLIKTPISAEWVLKRIQEEKRVRLNNASIEGDIDISKLDLPTEHVERTDLQKAIGLTEDLRVVKSSIEITNSHIQGDLKFSNSILRENAYFRESKFSGNANFGGSEFSGNAYFRGSKFSGYAYFGGSEFSGDAYFGGSEFNGKSLDFRGTEFNRLQDQELPCRHAKQLAQNLGDKEEADNYYYREMEGRRIRLQEEKVDKWDISFPIKRTIELNTDAKRALFNAYRYLRYNLFEAIFIERIFGYGVRPYQLAAWWLFAVLIFGLAYWGLKGIHLSGDQIIPDNTAVTTFREYLYFSIVTSATPGYGGYRPHGVSQWIAGAQAIFGTFMWAAFITTFARKYMR